MSTKLLQSLTDENPDLQKQIGCMTGIFQLFDRHHIITGKRIEGRSHKRFSSARPHFNDGSLGTEANACSPQNTMHQSQNQRVSAESSRTSFSSSSCSSSYSSLDYIKAAQPEPPSLDGLTFSEQSSKTEQKFQHSHSDNKPNLSISCNDQSKSSSAKPVRQSLDFRDVVKDSIYREIHGSLVKTQTRDDLPKFQDSPRPLQLPKSEGSAKHGFHGNPRIPVDLNESLRVLSKLKEAPWYFTESRDPPRSSYESRDGSFLSGTKDAPRFSFDGREIHRQSFDSRDAGKSSTKLRELPRLSLDSRECSSKCSNFELKANSALKDLQRSNLTQKNFNNGVPNHQQELRSNREPPSVVARLMGLEAMPNSKFGEDLGCFSGEKNNSYFLGLSKPDKSREDPISCSPKSSLKDSASPRLRNPDSVMKPICNSRFPVEQAPWRQQDSGRNPQKTGFRVQESHKKPPASQFVYSEVEKRLKDLEFQHSDKDLRALKQLLDAMEAKGLLEGKKQEEGRASNFPMQRNNQNQNQIGIDLSGRLANKQNRQVYRPISPQIKGNCSPRAFESPIVIMKPAKFINKSGTSTASVIPVDGLSVIRSSKLMGECQTGNQSDRKKVSSNNRTPRDSAPKINQGEHVRVPGSKINGKIEENSSQKPRSRSNQTSPRSLQMTKDNSNNSIKSSGCLSPRLQSKKVESERKTKILPVSPDSSKSRRQSEVGSPGRKTRSSSNSIHFSQTEDQLSEISIETRNLSRQVDEISLQSDSNISLGSQVDIEDRSIDRSEELDLDFIQRDETVSALQQKKSSLNLSEDSSSSMESTAVVPEQPSPVSVFDFSFYRDDLMPSPVKKIPVLFKDDDISIEDGPDPADFNAGINRKKLESIESLVQKLKRLGSGHDTSKAATQPSLLLCDASNPDHQYVSEILLASGFLLQDLGSGSTPIRLHPSGHPINPDLFLVLEQTKASRLHRAETIVDERVPQPKPNTEKLRRKLMFDMVNEILGVKLEPVISRCEPWIRPNRLARMVPTGQRLLRELCQEIDRVGIPFSAEVSTEVDSVNDLENWTDFRTEISGLVLDVERLIFKDLVDEILSGEAWSHGAKPSRRRRQLFSN